MKCQLCGFEFDAGAHTCKGCIQGKNCELICCPNCGYQVPAQTRFADFVGRILKTKKEDGKTGN